MRRVNQLLSCPAVVLAALSLASVAQAQTVYKQTMANGQVVYSDRPVAGAVKSEEVHVLRSSSSAQSSGEAAPAATQDNGEATQQAANQQRIDDSRTLTADADARLEAARQALAAAEQALAQGQEPQPGERVGNVNGSSRLNEAYAQRVGQLERDVATAKQALQEAEQLRNQVR